MERIKIHNGLIAILEQGVLTSNLSVDPKKSLHVEETGKTPLVSSEPLESRLQETAIVPACAAGFLMAGPRLPTDLWNLQTMQHPSCPGISPNPGHQKKKKKEVALNQEQTCCLPGNGEARSLWAEHSSKKFGAHREGAKGTTCLYHRILFLSFTHPSVIPKRADKATV